MPKTDVDILVELRDAAPLDSVQRDVLFRALTRARGDELVRSGDRQEFLLRVNAVIMDHANGHGECFQLKLDRLDFARDRYIWIDGPEVLARGAPGQLKLPIVPMTSRELQIRTIIEVVAAIPYEELRDITNREIADRILTQLEKLR